MLKILRNVLVIIETTIHINDGNNKSLEKQDLMNFPVILTPWAGVRSAAL